MRESPTATTYSEWDRVCFASTFISREKEMVLETITTTTIIDLNVIMELENSRNDSSSSTENETR